MASKKMAINPSKSLPSEQVENKIREIVYTLYEERCVQNIEGDAQSDCAYG